ncbi:TPA: hypothetical protein QDA88_002676 [Burkholderia vietnamiensis]|nr:hypothetical protein [Burkholderia vietnamiensis]
MGKRRRKTEGAAEFDGLRTTARANYVGIAKDIQHMRREQLLVLQKRFGIGDTWGTLVFPENWVPPGAFKAIANRTISVEKNTKTNPEYRSKLELVITAITRLALILYLVPISGPRTGTVLLAPTSMISSLRYICYLVRGATSEAPNGDEMVFGSISSSALGNLIEQNAKLRTELNRLYFLRDHGYWTDVPPLPPLTEPPVVSRPPTSRSTQRGAENDVSVGAHHGRRGMRIVGAWPFPDEFVAEVGTRAIWFAKTLEPALVECVKYIQPALVPEIETSSDAQELKRARNRRWAKLRCAIKSFRWVDPEGNAIANLPFAINFPMRGPKCLGRRDWPPSTYDQILHLVTIAQVLHLCVMLLCMAGRISETLSLDFSAPPRRNKRKVSINGRTFKLEFSNEGAEKEWPLPDFGALVLERQLELRAAISTLTGVGADDEWRSQLTGEGSLWAIPSTGNRIDALYNDRLSWLVDVMDLRASLGEQKIHAHRFRVSIARLVALAIVGAPKILMDLFGHESIEMTLYYILKDPTIRAEMIEVAKAQVFMLAKSAITEIDECGGPAAPTIRGAVHDERVRLGHDFDEDDLTRLAEIFTLSGTYWQLVRPGVICTKLRDQTGPCNSQRGRPEPGACRSYCAHRLEMAALKDDVDRAISQALEEIARSLENDDEIGAEMWRGQVVMNLGRFPQLTRKWSRRKLFLNLMKGEARKV